MAATCEDGAMMELERDPDQATFGGWVLVEARGVKRNGFLEAWPPPGAGETFAAAFTLSIFAIGLKSNTTILKVVTLEE